MHHYKNDVVRYSSIGLNSTLGTFQAVKFGGSKGGPGASAASRGGSGCHGASVASWGGSGVPGVGGR